MAIWQFRSTSHGSSSLLSLLSPPISLFLSFSHSSSSLPAFLSSSHLPPLFMAVGAFPRSALELARPPSSPPNMSANCIEGWLQRMKCGILNDVSWLYAGSPGRVFWCRETWKSPCLRIQMKCSKTGPEPLFEIELLSKAALPTQMVFHHRTTAISFMLLSNSGCFSCLILLINSIK